MPRLIEFNAAMMRAGIRLVPSHLQSGKVEIWVVNPNDPMKKYSQLKYWSGCFAVVYEYNLASGGKRLIRCFFKDPDAAMQKRYRELRSFLKRQAAEFTAEFEYHADGIVVESGKDAPRHAIIDMQFVEGLELIGHVSKLCKSGDHAALKQLAEKWVQLTEQMRASGLAHGDLSGGDVMVTPDGKLVLLDYDGMYIPSLKDNVPSERGNSHYQHRDSNHKDPTKRRPYDQHMDDFSMLLIYVAILALAEKPTLFKQYVAHKSDGSLDGDNLLFQDVDLANPDQSKVFKGIAQECRDAELLKLLDKLKTSAKGLIRDVPSFESHFDPWVAIRGMIVQHSPDWKAIHAAAANVPQGVAIPPDVKRGCDDAREHVEALEALEKAIESGNADEVRQAWARKDLLVGWEDARQALADAAERIR